jgi:hypothetical protein
MTEEKVVFTKEEIEFLNDCSSSELMQGIVRKMRNIQLKEIREIRIFVHDPEDSAPYHLMIDGEIQGAFTTIQEAYEELEFILREAGELC